MSLDDLIKKRIEEAEKARAASSRDVRAQQNALYTLLLEWFGKLDTDGGRIKSSAANYGRASSLSGLFARWQRQYSRTMLGSVLEWAGRIFGANEAYFEAENPDEAIISAARRNTLLRWGYDVRKKAIVPGGYFEYLFNNEQVARRVASTVNMAIGQGMPMAEFQKQFKAVFVGRPGGGMLERHWNTVSFDLYQRIDRTANLIYADELGLNFAVYSGTLEEDSRPFCVARVNKVFDRKQIEGWRNLNFSGKPKIGYDPFTDCGGYNCRHHLSWVSDEVADQLTQK